MAIMSSPVSRTVLPTMRPWLLPPVMWMPSARLRRTVLSAMVKWLAPTTRMPAEPAEPADWALDTVVPGVMVTPRTTLPVSAVPRLASRYRLTRDCSAVLRRTSVSAVSSKP